MLAPQNFFSAPRMAVTSSGAKFLHGLGGKAGRCGLGGRAGLGGSAGAGFEDLPELPRLAAKGDADAGALAAPLLLGFGGGGGLGRVGRPGVTDEMVRRGLTEPVDGDVPTAVTAGSGATRGLAEPAGGRGGVAGGGVEGGSVERLEIPGELCDLGGVAAAAADSLESRGMVPAEAEACPTIGVVGGEPAGLLVANNEPLLLLLLGLTAPGVVSAAG